MAMSPYAMGALQRAFARRQQQHDPRALPPQAHADYARQPMPARPAPAAPLPAQQQAQAPRVQIGPTGQPLGAPSPYAQSVAPMAAAQRADLERVAAAPAAVQAQPAAAAPPPPQNAYARQPAAIQGQPALSAQNQARIGNALAMQQQQQNANASQRDPNEDEGPVRRLM